ncbi:MAG TPA: NADH-quinone oxidoreductase subunit NuoF [Spirochaetia bacterium]|nr:NADH-quinone oxidoreductase subunit NuoF [Spirochaetales bacterium]HRY78850.1 NADH-quinone oxidoreductase subunit NuoF [Spirochaetia bacterium]HRZ89389.1 NADH-quinone oxidoreductase subunit NuoF [Spirochaetia bacterium]
MIPLMHVILDVGAEAEQAGARKFREVLEAKLRKEFLSEDVRIVESANLGVSGQGVCMLVYPDEVYYGNLKLSDADRIVDQHFINGKPVEELFLDSPEMRRLMAWRRREGIIKKGRGRVVLDNVGAVDPENLAEYKSRDGFRALAEAVRGGTPEGVLDTVKRSGLRGRGGAGFPTGMKWEAVREAPGDRKYVICNADEGEPGTFKDRIILEGDPFRVLEAMALAGYATGAEEGYVYVRGEYRTSIDRLENAIRKSREAGYLGRNILGSPFSFEVRVKEGAGAYICGEETALIESLEGKRGTPRLKPPYPVTEGLWGRPTVVNNVETLANVPPILRNGADWFRKFGTERSPGTKIYLIIGHVVSPGLVEVETTTSLRELIYGYGGGIRGRRRLKAVQVGGSSGGIFDPSVLDEAMHFDALKEKGGILGSGSMLVMDETTCIVDMVHGILNFFLHESCGACFPCRIGNERLVRTVNGFRSGSARPSDIDLLEEIASAMKVASYCALGQSPFLPLSTAIRYFREEFEEHVNGKCRAGVCRFKVLKERQEARRWTVVMSR